MLGGGNLLKENPREKPQCDLFYFRSRKPRYNPATKVSDYSENRNRIYMVTTNWKSWLQKLHFFPHQLWGRISLKVSKCFEERFSKSWRHTTTPLFSSWFWFRWLRTRLPACPMRYREMWWNFQVFTLQQSHFLRQQNLRNFENFLVQCFCHVLFKAWQSRTTFGYLQWTRQTFLSRDHLGDTGDTHWRNGCVQDII